jgi:hypothetical protein
MLAHLDEDGAAVGAARLGSGALGRRGPSTGREALHHHLKRRHGARPHGRADRRVAPLAAPPVKLPVGVVLHDQRPQEVRLPHARRHEAEVQLVVQGVAAVVLQPVPAIEAHELVGLEVAPPARAPDQVEGELLMWWG